MSQKARKTIIAGNWKMNKTVAEAKALALAVVQGMDKELAGETLPDVVLCPTFVCLSEVLSVLNLKDAKRPLFIGAQNMDHRDSGAFTGEIAPPMLTSIGVTHVVIGHSERRQFFGETNESVNLKTKAALAHGLTPIVCVGETLAERENGTTDKVIKEQVVAAFKDISEGEASRVVVAYEPVWAIGTGKNCESPEANRVCGHIRSTINEVYGSKVADLIPVLYGGSVKASTIDEQMEQPDIDGALVGGAALKAEEFLPIIRGGAKRTKQMAAVK